LSIVGLALADSWHDLIRHAGVLWHHILLVKRRLPIASLPRQRMRVARRRLDRLGRLSFIAYIWSRRLWLMYRSSSPGRSYFQRPRRACQLHPYPESGPGKPMTGRRSRIAL
jgi:hypothetical protein